MEDFEIPIPIVPFGEDDDQDLMGLNGYPEVDFNSMDEED